MQKPTQVIVEYPAIAIKVKAVLMSVDFTDDANDAICAAQMQQRPISLQGIPLRIWARNDWEFPQENIQGIRVLASLVYGEHSEAMPLDGFWLLNFQPQIVAHYSRNLEAVVEEGRAIALNKRLLITTMQWEKIGKNLIRIPCEPLNNDMKELILWIKETNRLQRRKIHPIRLLLSRLKRQSRDI